MDRCWLWKPLTTNVYGVAINPVLLLLPQTASDPDLAPSYGVQLQPVCLTEHGL